MAGKDNLKPFKKGFDPRRNLEGAPPKIRSLDVLMAEVIGDEGIVNVLEALQKQALKGNVNAIQIMLDRQFGKPKQSLEIDAKVDLTPQIIVKPPKTDNDPDRTV